MRNVMIIFWTVGMLLVLSACTYTQKIRDGRTAYELMYYSDAITLLKKEYGKSKSRIEKGKIAFLLGESYKAMNKSDQSLEWYQIAYDNQYGVDALKEYAYGLKRAERYKEALDAFKNLGLEIGSPYEYRREILSCRVAAGWQQDERQEYEVELLEFNTAYADYSPTFFKENQLVFTSDRKASTGDDLYGWTGNEFSDLFVVDLNSNDVSTLEGIFNTEDNDGTVVFNTDYTEAYFVRCTSPKKAEYAYCGIYMSENLGDSWSVPEPLSFIEEGINYGHPCLSADGKQLYFSSNHPDGWGGFDIYVSERTLEGWEAPKLLSRTINTIGNEQFPTIDGDTLYFSSDFHTGMGGLDIFKTYPLRNGSWAPVFNLKAPINSGGDDFGFIVDNNTVLKAGVLQTGYFSSTRNEGMGNDDIYRFEKIVLPPLPPKPVVKVEPKMILNGYVLEKIYEEPGNPNSKILGRKPLPESDVEIVFGNQKETVTVGDDGLFSLELDKNQDYSFLASKENYLNKDAAFTTKGIGEDPNNPIQTFEIEIVLDKIFLDKEIVLENIYYDLDKADIREDAEPTLNELAKNLSLNPNIKIELSSHTDCRASDRYNLNLSQRRAQSAVDYLIAEGIDPSRLIAKGYGESQPAVDCICSRCTEEQHQANRRTAFKIIE